MTLSVFRFAGLALVLVSLVGAQPGLATAVTLTLAVLLVALVASSALPVPPALAHAETLRQRSRRTAFVSQCDPDAPGRPRSRAPSPA